LLASIDCCNDFAVVELSADHYAHIHVMRVTGVPEHDNAVGGICQLAHFRVSCSKIKLQLCCAYQSLNSPFCCKVFGVSRWSLCTIILSVCSLLNSFWNIMKQYSFCDSREWTE